MTDQDKPKTVVSGQVVVGKVKNQLSKKMTIAVVVIVLALIALSWFFLSSQTKDNKSNQTANSPKCSADVLKEASAKLASYKAEQLQTLVSQIEKTSGYDKEPNCLFITTSYYVNISDYTKASADLKKLTTVDPKATRLRVSGLFEGKVALDKLTSQVSILKKQIDNQSGGAIPSEAIKN